LGQAFSDANLLLLSGRHPSLADNGFVGQVEDTAAWVRAQAGHAEVVVNTRRHSDHIGGNFRSDHNRVLQGSRTVQRFA
jgi:hydroxyacylglutathione hydrolase